MFDWVMRQSGFPDFCIRTLCGDGKIASDEIGFLRANDCKIGLAVRDLTEAAVSATDGTPEAWTPFCPSALEPDDMALWVCGEIAFDSLTVKKVYKKGSDPLEFMW